MGGLFKNILVPVDFSYSTEVAVKQAVELADSSGSGIHLLHVMKPKSIWNEMAVIKHMGSPLAGLHGDKNAMSKLLEWKHAIEETIPNIIVNTSLMKGSVHSCIEAVAKQIKPQLIIIGKKNNSCYFTVFNPVDPNRLAKSTACPVLTAMRGSVHTKTKTIVVPVTAMIPRRKIELVFAFAERYRSKIHLVAPLTKSGICDIERKALLDTYRILRAALAAPIEYHIIRGNNFPKATLGYAERIGADIILVNPRTETKVSNFMGRHITDMLPSASKLRILSVEPYPGK